MSRTETLEELRLRAEREDAELRKRWRREGPSRPERLLVRGSLSITLVLPGRVDALVRTPTGHRSGSPSPWHVYRCGWTRTLGWWCTCASPRQPCAHVLALSRVVAEPPPPVTPDVRDAAESHVPAGHSPDAACHPHKGGAE